mmetsp:Transcript_80912/g.127397  ORF Transcript_80912/g.127397 Transcript_80912/m.127397 type:complete len:112 (-) Transcript_80912:229-564(-)
MKTNLRRSSRTTCNAGYASASALMLCCFPVDMVGCAIVAFVVRYLLVRFTEVVALAPLADGRSVRWFVLGRISWENHHLGHGMAWGLHPRNAFDIGVPASCKKLFSPLLCS